MDEMWRDEHEGMTAVVSYEEETHRYHVTVTRGDDVEHDSFLATYEPFLGMDVGDMDHSLMIAEQLAVLLDERDPT